MITILITKEILAMTVSFLSVLLVGRACRNFLWLIKRDNYVLPLEIVTSLAAISILLNIGAKFLI